MKYTIQPYYIEELKQLRDTENEACGIVTLSSVEGLVEQAISNYLYQRKVALDIFPRRLPVVEINGKRYSYNQDSHLKEYSAIKEPHDSITWIKY
jgi:hypothetical protein